MQRAMRVQSICGYVVKSGSENKKEVGIRTRVSYDAVGRLM